MTRAEQLIRKARFSKRYQGYQYLLQCVELVLDDDSRLCALSKQYTSPWLRNTASPAGALDGISAQPGTTPGREDAKNSLKKSAVEPSMRPHLSGN